MRISCRHFEQRESASTVPEDFPHTGFRRIGIPQRLAIDAAFHRRWHIFTGRRHRSNFHKAKTEPR